MAQKMDNEELRAVKEISQGIEQRHVRIDDNINEALKRLDEYEHKTNALLKDNERRVYKISAILTALICIILKLAELLIIKSF